MLSLDVCKKSLKLDAICPPFYENWNTFDDYHSSSYPGPEAKSMQKTKINGK